MIPVATFYRFAPLPDPAARREEILALGREAGLTGTVILAGEGVNGTVAGNEAGLARLAALIGGWPGFEGIAPRLSRAEGLPFGRMKVKLRREIVTLGAGPLDPVGAGGRRVAPAEWNDLIRQAEVAVIDTRNACEVAVGTFAGAEDPGTVSFADFPAWWEANRARLEGKRIAMFCTGGIRCEKASAFLRREGVEEVLQLDGGILRYLAEVPEGESLWRGGCFVFDGRGAVGHGLAPLPGAEAAR